MFCRVECAGREQKHLGNKEVSLLSLINADEERLPSHTPFHSNKIMNTQVVLKNLVYSRLLIKLILETLVAVWRRDECLVITHSGVLF